MDLASLTEIGRLLYGEDWQRPLARGLGPLHPDGARESIDDRLVRRWAAGDRPIPAWVGQAVLKLMLKGATVYEKRARALRVRADELRGEIDPIQLVVPEQEELPIPRM